MDKSVFYDKNAVKELGEFDKKVQIHFQALIDVLLNEGRLSFPDARKLTKDIFEIRIQHQGIFRGCYAYIESDIIIIILHFFQKKAQSTPLKNIRIAQQRLKRYA